MKKMLVIILCLCTVAAATQLSFNSGRLSPKMKYRIDVDARSMAAQQMTNIVVRTKGMAAKRSGTEFIDDANSTDDVRLIPFEYSTDDAYVFEFGHEYIGFFRTTQ